MGGLKESGTGGRVGIRLLCIFFIFWAVFLLYFFACWAGGWEGCWWGELGVGVGHFWDGDWELG